MIRRGPKEEDQIFKRGAKKEGFANRANNGGDAFIGSGSP